eukprot:NODE_3919_length_1141_cov_33.722986_g3729_i0.p1 GENE.NODE_3919_length_1141_cov_33.722986_g3729_i0~~NODE_3919_length_1141_cov_33.722986_g3729_i0.p1  ORF type:complete len:353 (+),score=71.12 NODE_3919_length_1141_cov_33.722986_g3729_i0:72-1130(+)
MSCDGPAAKKMKTGPSPAQGDSPAQSVSVTTLHEELVNKLDSLSDSDRSEFIALLKESIEYYERPALPAKPAAEVKLEKIQEELRSMVPADGMGKGEEMCYPDSGVFEGWTKVNTAHVDSFLYGDDDLIDEMCDEGRMSRYYCTSSKCGYSRKVKELNFISHSFSVPQLRFVFEDMLDGSKGGLKDKIVVDVGSRLGAVVYYGALFTDAKEVVGIERSKYFADLQRRVIKKHGLSPRASVLEADVFSEEGQALLKRADVVIMNNVFEWFYPTSEEHMGCYRKIRDSLSRSGQILIMNPSLETSVTDLKKAKLDKWVRLEEVRYPATPGLGPGDEEPNDEFESVRTIHKYTVL